MVAGAIFRHARADVEATRGAGGTPDLKVIFDSLEHNQNVATISPTRLSGSYEDMYDHAPGTETNELLFGGLVDFNQMALWGSLFFKGITAGTGAGADKAWAFLPTQTTDDLKSLYVQLGQTDTLSATTPGVEIPYCVGEEFTLGYSKAPDSPGITFSARLLGGAATDITAYTGAAAEPTLQLASHINTQVYVDESGGTIGTTEDDYFTAADFTLNNNWVNLFTLNAETSYQDTFRPNARTWAATLTRYYQNDTERARYKTKTERLVRIRTTGAVLGAGTYRMDLDLYGVWETRQWTDSDGLTLEQMVMRRKYNAAAGTSVNLGIVNALASI